MSMSKVLLSPPPMRSGSCGQQGQGPATPIATEVKTTAAVRDKTEVNIEVEVPVVAGSKVEKSKLKEFVAAMVTGEGVVAEVPPGEPPDTPKIDGYTNLAEGEVPGATAQ